MLSEFRIFVSWHGWSLRSRLRSGKGKKSVHLRDVCLDEGFQLEDKEFHLVEVLEIHVLEFVLLEQLNHDVESILFITNIEQQRSCYEVHPLYIA
jgi:hypothetical protein